MNGSGSKAATGLAKGVPPKGVGALDRETILSRPVPQPVRKPVTLGAHDRTNSNVGVEARRMAIRM